MKKKIGRYRLGTHDVDVFWTQGPDGSFDCADKRSGRAQITVGLDQKHWDEVVAILLHEATEMALTTVCCRFSPTPDYSNSAATYLFVMDHEQFAEVVGRVAVVVAGALPGLATAYKKHGKKLRS